MSQACTPRAPHFHDYWNTAWQPTVFVSSTLVFSDSRCPSFLLCHRFTNQRSISDATHSRAQLTMQQPHEPSCRCTAQRERESKLAVQQQPLGAAIALGA